MTRSRDDNVRVVIVGSGIAGLCAAARLAHHGPRVLVLERHATPGGKMRSLPSAAGPVDAGPTVLTLRGVFDELFHDLGERLEDHLTLIPQRILARHFWPDGSRLDLHDTEDDSAEAIRAFAGSRAAAQFRTFSARARTLFNGFDAPVMQAPAPSLPGLAAHVMRNPHLLRPMAPLSTLADVLNHSFDDPRLAQLFGRYATYVGGSPYHVPGLLALIWQAEAAGVWVVHGGMHRLACALQDLAQARGAEFRFGAHVERIEATPQDGTRAVLLADGTRIPADTVLFNGDPKALATGALGPDCAHVAPQTRAAPRSLSAEVWAFAATPQGPDLAHHNVFFRDDPKSEFDALDRGALVPDPTLYVCAQDRGQPGPSGAPERFEIIANAPPLQDAPHKEDHEQCQTRTFRTLARFGLTFDPTPEAAALTTPAGFDRLFPASDGSLYGQSPHGMTAAFKRPTARTAIPGLYLAGGGTHPGAGVPMAALSGRHAVAAIMQDRTSISTSRKTAMPGGTSTGSAPTGAARSASSRS
ncbi:1-hydroxycarotenoid 3,4-desaturase CrtD [Roseovarius sp. D22-M7]|uniref:1-hydroxycarotenoid 3,4-desaturase CrtD n=1 Tax=Roseovarius sp. D22-M7 TaxID=3127116 RepID=UPI0030102338